MSGASSIDAILSEAKEREKEYDWPGAAESYKRALGLLPEQDYSSMGEIYEWLGYAFYRIAMQAESVDEFRSGLHLAVANYEKAKEFFGRLSERATTPRMLRCDAVIAYVGYWLASEVSEKKRLLDECWRLTKEALNAFEEAGNALEYGKTYNQLSSSAFHKFVFEWNFQAAEKTIREAMEHGEQTITLLPGVGDSHELARAYVNTAAYLTVFGFYFVPDMDEKERQDRKVLSYWQKAVGLSEEAASIELLTTEPNLTVWNFDELLVNIERALAYARKTKDKYLIGAALDQLAYAGYWKGGSTEELEKRMETLQRALGYAEEAKHQFSLISYVSSRGGSFWTGAPHAEYYWLMANWETDLMKRRDLLEKALVYGTHGVKQAESADYPAIVGLAHHVLGKVLGSLAKTERNSVEKKRLLERALEHRNKALEISEQLYQFSYWELGVVWGYLADLKAELAKVEKDSEARKNMLEEAVSDKERSLQLCIKQISHAEKVGELAIFYALGLYQYSYGELLVQLYGLTKNSAHQMKAIKTFEEAAESFQKRNLVSRVAECYWKAARGYDALGEHLKAAEDFNFSSSSYANAAEKIPQLKSFYQDHALYMQAWSEIEKARHHHSRQEYHLAKEHFEKAAKIHECSTHWDYLATNYSAWARVEHAEDLSREEQSEEAIITFEQAVQLFNQTKKSIQIELTRIESLDEKQMAANMLKATGLRLEYYIARIALEEARILDKKGDHRSSSQKYGSAVETFEKISQALESEQEQKEFEFIISLSRAWQRMMLAEARASSELYMEASQLFERASEHSSSEKTSFLTLGHSRFCKALEAGTKFADTGDQAMHAVATQHLESAAKYYVKAGFQNASEYAKSTELLFDAYVYMDNAKREQDPEKKTKFYTMAERVLQSSAGSFMKADHLEKREQVLRLLEKVKEERELALSLSEVLHAPTIVSATTAFSTPAPTHESAVGLERFEHADIQANLVTRQKELKVGESLNLEIELVNAGKGPALLTKITEIIPEGFELTEKPEIYRVEDSYLNMKGKRLDPLKMEEVKLVLKPKVQGVFPLKPTILYLDEDGKYKSHEPEPITITVKELGIKGWIKGER